MLAHRPPLTVPLQLLLLCSTLFHLPGFALAEDNAAKTAPEGEPQCIGFGIDLGTTFSALAVCLNGVCETIKNIHGNSIMPSVVQYDESGNPIAVGEPADQLADENPKLNIRLAKNFIGRTYEEIKDNLDIVPYKVVPDKNGMAAVEINGKIISFPEVSAQVLKTLDQAARKYIKSQSHAMNLSDLKVKYAITVPAYFNQPKRKATKDASIYAGMDLISLYSEPVAASLLMLNGELSTTVVVDIGGGTTDITVQRVDEGVYVTKSTTGNLHLGGFNFDRLIASWLKEKALAKKEEINEAQLLKTAEQIKIQLSTEEYAETDYGIFTKHKFNSLMAPYVEEVKGLIHTAISKSGYTLDEIDYILLVGGSARIPIWQDMIKKEFKKEVIVSSNPDHAIALGAAQLAAQMCNHGEQDKVMITTVSHGYAVKSLRGNQEVATFIVEENSNVPARFSKVFSTAVDFQPEVSVEILQGFDQNVSKNTKIGTIQYGGLPLKRAGQVEIEVEFYISEEQIMTAKVLGKYPGAVPKELVLTLDDKIENEEIERRKKEAKEEAEYFNYVLDVEQKLNDARYAIDSKLTKDAVEEAHKKFIIDLLKEWDDLKSKHRDVEHLKSVFDAKLEKAIPILEKINEAKAEALKKHDESSAKPETTTTSTKSAPDDL